ncbi:hypothetical protein [Larkinella soli]|uniref:hypothetical protein n=1 Tax=Larkinella soli TaxID=1770527 RepID=UPI000FFC6802|nr:hypothetical protein [Larkinella soli]
MLTQYEYSLLPLTMKADLLWRHGRHLLNRQLTPFVVSLYSVGDFFVEAYFVESEYYNNSHELQDLHSFCSDDLQKLRRPHPFEPYLDQIDLRLLIGA